MDSFYANKADGFRWSQLSDHSSSRPAGEANRGGGGGANQTNNTPTDAGSGMRIVSQLCSPDFTQEKNDCLSFTSHGIKLKPINFIT